MKKRILLIDESLTVQKVVSLTLDKGVYQVIYARNRQEVIKQVVDASFDLILLSENVSGLSWQTFPKELESWLGKIGAAPPVALISGQNIKEAKHYVGVLKKPFTPQELQGFVSTLLVPMTGMEPSTRDFEMQLDDTQDNLKATFNKAFADEDSLVRQTFAQNNDERLNDTSVINLRPKMSGDEMSKQPTPRSATELWKGSTSKEGASQRVPGEPQESTEDLWGTNPLAANGLSEDLNHMVEKENPVLTAQDSMAYKSALEHEVKSKLQNQDLYPMVEKALAELLPPIVERMVQERLDKLLQEHEESLAS